MCLLDSMQVKQPMLEMPYSPTRLASRLSDLCRVRKKAKKDGLEQLSSDIYIKLPFNACDLCRISHRDLPTHHIRHCCRHLRWVTTIVVLKMGCFGCHVDTMGCLSTSVAVLLCREYKDGGNF